MSSELSHLLGTSAGESVKITSDKPPTQMGQARKTRGKKNMLSYRCSLIPIHLSTLLGKSPSKVAMEKPEDFVRWFSHENLQLLWGAPMFDYRKVSPFISHSYPINIPWYVSHVCVYNIYIIDIYIYVYTYIHTHMYPIWGYDRSGSLLLPRSSLRPRVASSLRFSQPAHGATVAEHRFPHRLCSLTIGNGDWMRYHRDRMAYELWSILMVNNH